MLLKTSIVGCCKLFLYVLSNWKDPVCEFRQLHIYIKKKDKRIKLTYNQCRNILKIAKGPGIKRIVYSTTFDVSQLDNNVRVATGSFMEKHTINKKSIEQAVKDAGFNNFTFLRPTFFMANFLKSKIRRCNKI
jgi:hypothetical protein